MVFIVMIGILLLLSAVFSTLFVVYEFDMMPSDYTMVEKQGKKPKGADTSFWFSYGDENELQYGREEISKEISGKQIQLYAQSRDGVEKFTLENENSIEKNGIEENKIKESYTGTIIAAVPEFSYDIDYDGKEEIIYDYARADFGPETFELLPRQMSIEEIPFEVAFAERKYMQVFWKGEILTDAELIITSKDGIKSTYKTNQHGWIDGLPISVLQHGFTVQYSRDENHIYRFYYVLETFAYFTPHFYHAYVPLIYILLFSIVGIIGVCIIRFVYWKKTKKAENIRQKIGIRKTGNLVVKGNKNYLLIRWCLLFFGMFLWTFAGKLFGQGQRLNTIAIPVFSCPFNLDQILEVPCFYLSHIRYLFIRNVWYIFAFCITLFFSILFLGRILCGFLCPMGLLQDLFYKLREILHIKPIYISERINHFLQAIKWIWIILFLGMGFAGFDFCNICPVKIFATASGGFWTNLYIGGIFSIILLIGSFFIERFWCLLCPLGYLMGLLHKFNLFQLKKDCTSCTTCGACYEACPMRLKNIYTERNKEQVQTVNCIMCGKCVDKCPENHALSITFCGKNIYQSSKIQFLKKYDKFRKKWNKEERRGNVYGK